MGNSNNPNTIIPNEVINKTSYSTEETVVDTWIDGKPIYRVFKEIYCSDIPNQQSNIYSIQINHNLDNIEQLWINKSKSIIRGGGWLEEWINF